MNNLFNISAGVLIFLLSMTTAALTADLSDDGGAFVDEGRPESAIGLSSDKKDQISNYGDMRSVREKAEEINMGQARLIDNKPKKDGVQIGNVQKRMGIILKTEPGDGLVSLSWTATGFDVPTGSQSLKFTVFYGSEPGRYDNKIEVGAVLEHKIRELKNNNIYYIKVHGYNRDKTVSMYSREERVIPLPEEEIGSFLEKSFSESAVTLQDKINVDVLKRKLRQFGYDFFKNTLLSGAASDNLTVGDEYILGPGDSIYLDVWGSINASSELTVDRNGELTIPKIGTVKVWGLTYGQIKEAVNKAISHYYKGYEINMTMGKLHPVQVYVVGEVNAPGTYNVSSLGTVVNSLAIAGGPSKSGSLRTIKILKNGKNIQELDLYDFFLTGDRSRDIRLVNGSTIFVPVIGPVAAVAGEVKRPAVYELKGKTTLKQLLDMAGGITAASYIGRIQIERFEENNARVVLDYEIKDNSTDDKLSSVEIHDRDMVKVFPVNKALRKVVTLKGNAARPGDYQFKKGMRLLDLIPGYESLLPESYLDAVQIMRLVLPDFHREALSINLAKALAGDPAENILLQEQDSVKVYSRQDMMEKRIVTITGEVLHPGPYDYYDNLRVRDLIADAGSIKRNAFLDTAELTRIVIEGGKARSTQITVDLKKALDGDPAHNVVLQPEDSLIVRAIPNWLEASDRFVTLKGEVRFPGTFSIAKGEKLSTLILRAGGFTEKAYLKGAKFTRRSVQENQQKRMEEIIAKTEQDILKKQVELSSLAASKEELEATRASLDSLMKSIEKLKLVKAEGRMVIRLSEPEYFLESPYNVELKGGDVLDIPQTPNEVNVMGQVYSPTTLIFMPDKKVSYYLLKAGGPNRDAEEGEMYVLKADGTIVSREQSSFGFKWDEDDKGWKFGGFLSAKLDPGDTLVVPQKIDRTAWIREIKDITTIISQIAMTAGVILIGLK